MVELTTAKLQELRTKKKKLKIGKMDAFIERLRQLQKETDSNSDVKILAALGRISTVDLHMIKKLDFKSS